LKAIGRGLDTKISTEEWSEFWKTSGVQLRKNGLPVRDRRFVLLTNLLRSPVHEKIDMHFGA